MKICILANALSVHTQRWAKAFAEQGHDVHLVSIRYVELEGVKVHTVNIGRPNSNSVILTFLSYFYLLLTSRKVLRELQPDVVISYYTITYGVIAAFAGCHPSIAAIMGDDVIFCTSRLATAMKRILNKYVLKRADLICSTSRFMIKNTVDLRPQNVPITHIPFGVNCDLFCKMPHLKNNETDSCLRLGFVKTLLPKYAPDILLSAMPKICEQVPDVHLIIAGRGMMDEQLKNMTKELGIADKVTLTGFIANEKLPELFNSFDIFVHPSIWDSETFGVVVVEASACGCPVVATRVGGVPEVCIDGQTGILVEPNNPDALAEAIIKLAKNPQLRHNMGKAGRDFVVNNYDWNKNVQSMLQVMKNTISEYKK
jgi:glycosyltransferase involved in cell wall biosynthesis